MNYRDLLESHLEYGTTVEDILNKKNYDKILKNVVIAPWWDHSIFYDLGFNVEQVNDKIYNFYSYDLSFSFIEIKQFGACNLMEYVLPLGVTKAKNLVFLGSAGSLDENIKIGDLVIPEYSLCCDGASRFLNKNLEDNFFKKTYPSFDLTKKLMSVIEAKHLDYHYVPNVSADTIFAQFFHLKKFLELGAKTIEMETACLFKCNDLLKINMCALFCISDNSALKKSVFSGRSLDDHEYRHNVRNNIIPDIVIDLFKKI